MTFNQMSDAFTSGTCDCISDEKINITFNSLDANKQLEYFLGAVYTSNVFTVYYLLDGCLIPKTGNPPSFNLALVNILSELDNATKQGDEEALMVYRRVVKYFNL
jgi:hypothetical protein